MVLKLRPYRESITSCLAHTLPSVLCEHTKIQGYKDSWYAHPSIGPSIFSGRFRFAWTVCGSDGRCCPSPPPRPLSGRSQEIPSLDRKGRRCTVSDYDHWLVVSPIEIITPCRMGNNKTMQPLTRFKWGVLAVLEVCSP